MQKEETRKRGRWATHSKGKKASPPTPPSLPSAAEQLPFGDHQCPNSTRPWTPPEATRCYQEKLRGTSAPPLVKQSLEGRAGPLNPFQEAVRR